MASCTLNLIMPNLSSQIIPEHVVVREILDAVGKRPVYACLQKWQRRGIAFSSYLVPNS